jgi:ActR/RegA family two-component response regulator
VKLKYRKVLIVEDDYLQASDYRNACEAAQCIVIGPVATEEAAIELLHHDVPDFAILDLNLGSGISLKVAEALVEQDVPFAFATGYGCEAIPSKFQSKPCIAKPVDTTELIELLERVLP